MENDQVCISYCLVPRANEISTSQGLLVDLYVPRKCAATSMYLKTDRPVLTNVYYLQTVSSHPKITPQCRSVSPMLTQMAGLWAPLRLLPSAGRCGLRVRAMILSTDWQLRKGVSFYILLFASCYTDYDASAPECLVIPEMMEWAIVLAIIYTSVSFDARSCAGENWVDPLNSAFPEELTTCRKCCGSLIIMKTRTTCGWLDLVSDSPINIPKYPCASSILLFIYLFILHVLQ